MLMKMTADIRHPLTREPCLTTRTPEDTDPKPEPRRSEGHRRIGLQGARDPAIARRAGPTTSHSISACRTTIFDLEQPPDNGPKSSPPTGTPNATTTAETHPKHESGPSRAPDIRWLRHVSVQEGGPDTSRCVFLTPSGGASRVRMTIFNGTGRTARSMTTVVLLPVGRRYRVLDQSKPSSETRSSRRAPFRPPAIARST